MRVKRGSLAASGLFAFALLAPLRAEIILSNPGIPAREELVYERRTGGTIETVSIELIFREVAGLAVYEYVSRAPDADTRAVLDAANLFAREVETTSRQGGDVVRRTALILSTRRPAEDAVLLAGVETMGVALRGFPFGVQRRAKLEFVGTGSGGFSFDFAVMGRERIVAAGRPWECWKTQIGLGGIFAAFGKTTLWYAVAPPHVLVRSEGISGPPGSPSVLLELASYRASGLAWPNLPPRP